MISVGPLWIKDSFGARNPRVLRAKAALAFKNRNLIVDNPYPLGSLVYAYNNTRTQKLEAVYEGPFTVAHSQVKSNRPRREQNSNLSFEFNFHSTGYCRFALPLKFF